jgi:hypothetical protein
MNAERDGNGWNKIIETTVLGNDSCAQSAATSTVIPLIGILITPDLIPCRRLSTGGLVSFQSGVALEHMNSTTYKQSSTA